MNQVRLSLQVEDDVLWKGNMSGIFLVKMVYYTIKNGPGIRSDISKMWNWRAPPRFKVFAWLLLLNKLLTTENLNRQGFNLVSICYICRANKETTTHHLFNDSQTTRRVCHEAFRSIISQHTGILNAQTNLIEELVNMRLDKEQRFWFLYLWFGEKDVQKYSEKRGNWSMNL